MKKPRMICEIFLVVQAFLLSSFVLAISDGVPAVEAEFPFIVQLEIVEEETNLYTCAGTILTSNIILTAAHCVTNLSSHSMPTQSVFVRVIAGDIYSFRGGGVESFVRQTRTVRHVIVHDLYNSTSQSLLHDIAVLVLTTPLVLNTYVKPIPIAEQDQKLTDDAQFCGWGETRTTTTSDILLKTSLNIMSGEDCGGSIKRAFSHYADHYGTYPVSQNETWSGVTCTVGTNICQGDSGGPLTCSSIDDMPFLCGIASGQLSAWSPKWPELNECGGTNRPSIFTNVARFSNWIKDQMNKYNFTCGSERHNCGDGVCVHETAQCDNRVDCFHGSDEIGCGPCTSTQFMCASRSPPKCIANEYICDGRNDCGLAASDELGCGQCNLTQFTCADGTCVQDWQVCDGEKDCGDASDEVGCGDCLGTEFRCNVNSQCVRMEVICDGNANCMDGSDESNCVYDEDTQQKESREGHCDRAWDFATCVRSPSCVFNSLRRECMALNGVVPLASSNAPECDWESSDKARNEDGFLIFIYICVGFGISVLTTLLLILVIIWFMCRHTTKTAAA